VIAVAEPDQDRRAVIAQRHGIPLQRQFASWDDLLAMPRLADAVINTLMDRLHKASTIRALELGYHVLLEKPMASSMEDCAAIDDARRRHDRMVCVCHTMRYRPIYAELKSLLEQGAIGDLVSFDLAEGVEPIHQSHSFVRGNWGREADSAFMLLAKSCHDLDVLSHLVAQPCRRVSSFGSLSYFHSRRAPAGAPPRCTDGCPVETQCPYSAYKVYVQPEDPQWMRHAGMSHLDQAQRIEALKTNRFGRCVFHCDNDVVDHQVVNFEYEGGMTGTFTMTAFAWPGGRLMRLHGTEGWIQASAVDGRIEVLRFADHQRTVIHTPQKGSHGGGDHQLMVQFTEALRTGDPRHIRTPTDVSLASHRVVFAAELSRRLGRVVNLSEFDQPQTLFYDAESRSADGSPALT